MAQIVNTFTAHGVAAHVRDTEKWKIYTQYQRTHQETFVFHLYRWTLELLRTGNIQDLPQMIRIASARSKVNTRDYILAQQLLHEKNMIYWLTSRRILRFSWISCWPLRYNMSKAKMHTPTLISLTFTFLRARVLKIWKKKKKTIKKRQQAK